MRPPTPPAARAPRARPEPAPRRLVATHPHSAPPVPSSDAPRGRIVQAALAIVSAAVVAIGVLVYGWPVFIVMLLYWAENLLLGVANVLRIVIAGLRAGGASIGVYLFAAAFFTVHYGIFTVAHGMFVLALFGPGRAIDNAVEDPATVMPLLASTLAEPWVALALAAVLVSVAVDTLRWIAATRTDATAEAPHSLMNAPYGRMGVLHVTLIAGGALAMATGAPTAAAVLLVALKLGYDLIRLRRGDALGLFERKPASAGR